MIGAIERAREGKVVISSKRKCGQMGVADWLVVEESVKGVGGILAHSCGRSLYCFSVRVGGGLTHMPIQRGKGVPYVLPAFTLEPLTCMDIPICLECEEAPNRADLKCEGAGTRVVASKRISIPSGRVGIMVKLWTWWFRRILRVRD